MLKAAPIFTDHMVLQREKPLRIWGTSTEETVTAALGSCTGTAQVQSGRFELVLPPLPAGGPYTLTVTAGDETLTFTDVMLGEVWLCGGQSNMEMALKDTEAPEAALAACEGSGVRLYHVCKRAILDEQFFAEEAASCWQLPCPDTVQHWTAVGYYFACRLAEKLGVTVGLVECNYGGTSAAAWISRETLASFDAGQLYLADYDRDMEGMTDAEGIKAYLDYCDYHNQWQERVNACYQKDPQMPWSDVIARCGENRYPGPMAPNNPMRPHGLHDTMIDRIIPYTLRGVIYYQGESDDHRPNCYETLLRTLILEWRRDFRDESLPFLLVQLPMFAYEDTKDGDNWAVIRQAQERVYRTLRHTGLAAIPECGTFGDIHPKEKRTCAKRLYLQALREVYHMQDKNTTAPLLRMALPESGGMKLYFHNVDSGLELRGTEGFELCGADGVWHPAVPSANEDTVYLTSSEVAFPVGARYGWYNYGPVTLYEQNGLPAAPFRTA